MYEHDWYQEAEEAMRKVDRSEWPGIVNRFGQLYFTQIEGERRSKPEVLEILQSLANKIRGEQELPPYMVTVAPDGGDLTPDDLSHWPAWNYLEIQLLWDLHDGRNLGTMIVGVYKLAADGLYYVRDTVWGIMGDIRKTRRADPDDPGDRIA